MREPLFKLLAVLVLVGSFFAGWQLMRYQQFTEAPLAVGEEGLVIVVEPGSSLAAVARDLEARGAIPDARLMVWMARFKGAASDIKAGEYRIEPGTTPPQLLRQMVEGKVVHYSLTVVEGWTFRQLLAAMAADPNLEHTLAGLDGAGIMARIGATGDHPEGWFLPETYHFPRGMSDLEFLKRAYRAMSEALNAEWAARAKGLPLESPYEALILASIVEKETAVPEERPMIAGVFVRRLLKRMRLQTDPTIIYGLGPDFDGNLRRRHLRDPSNPYNTYQHAGLPPTPIALPGVDAIHAALNPADGDSLYFVARGDGSHAFSDSLDAHNKAVIKYQLNGRKRPFSSSP